MPQFDIKNNVTEWFYFKTGTSKQELSTKMISTHLAIVNKILVCYEILCIDIAMKWAQSRASEQKHESIHEYLQKKWDSLDIYS